MRKPSIFSRDYERKMRKRRKRIAIISVVTFLGVGLLFMKIAMSSINMDTFRNKVQMWIDEDKVSENKNDTTDSLNNSENIEAVEEAPKELEIKLMEFKVNDNAILKVEYEEVNGELTFKEVKDIPNNIYSSISQSKKLILTIDEKQNMKLFDINKKETTLTKDKYTAPNGEVFNKDSVIETYKEYLWNVEGKFITDKKIAYISNIPYFGYNLNKYIWVIDLDNNSHTTLWNSKGKEIKFGDFKDKGLEVNIDGNVKYINTNGELIN